MISMLRHVRGLAAAGAIMVLTLGAVALVSDALAFNPAIPYVDKDQDFNQPPDAWLLMAPPATTSGLTVDTQAGLARWITYGRYSTLQDCSATVQIVRNGVIPNSGLPAQMGNGAISFAAVPGGAAQSGDGTMQPGYPGAQPGGYPSMQPSYAGAPGYPPPQPNPAVGQSGYAGMQPGYTGMQSGYQAMQPSYQGTPGYAGMPSGSQGVRPGYASNQPIIQQPAQLMTRQQADEAYCFADNDRRLQGLIAPPAPAIPGEPGQSVPGTGQ